MGAFQRRQPVESAVHEQRKKTQPEEPPKSKYLLVSPWPVNAGTGVNNVILGIRDSMRRYYEPVIVSVGWTPPAADQVWLRLPAPELPVKNLFAFGVCFIPNLFRLYKLTRGAVAINPHFVGLQHLPLATLRLFRLCPRLILSVHGSDIDAALQSSRPQRALYRWMFSRADLVVACSSALAAKVKQIGPGAKIVAIWNGTAPAPPRRDERPIKAPYLVSVAAFVRKKGHDVLLRAFQRVAKIHRDLILVLLAGHGPEQGSVIALVHELGIEDRVRIYLDLPHEEIWDWLYHAECFVLASRDEPFGLAVLEAARARTPVVATRVGGIPEFLQNRSHGLLCEPDQPDELADTILEVLSDPVAARSRAHAFYLHTSHFTWDAACDRYRDAARLP